MYSEAAQSEKALARTRGHTSRRVEHRPVSLPHPSLTSTAATVRKIARCWNRRA